MTQPKRSSNTEVRDPLSQDIGRRIREARNTCGLSQLALGERVQLSRARINALEQGRVKRIDPSLLRRIADATQQSPDAFYRSPAHTTLADVVNSVNVSPDVGVVLLKLATLPLADQARLSRCIVSLISWYQAEVSPRLSEPQ